MPPLTRNDLAELHCIQPIANVRSILKLGILSNVGAEDVPHQSLADEHIQERRDNVVIPGTGGRRLHSYANLYVFARNKMMSKIRYRRGVDGICVLRVSLEVLDVPDVIIATQNASSGYARFHPSPGGLAYIDKDLVFARSWKHPDDQIMEWRHGSIMCAEVLVADRVDPEFITGAYTARQTSADELLASLDDGRRVEVTVNGNLFFDV